MSEMAIDIPDHQLIDFLADLDEDAVLKLVNRRIENGDDPLQLIEDCNEGMRLVGDRYEQGEYFISGLIMAGEIFREVMEIIQPEIINRLDKVTSGKILLGTVAGDIHEIGKNIASTLLSCHGFTVVDLGIDVPADEFARKAVEQRPNIVGLSGLISASIESMKDTVTVLRTAAKIHNLEYKIIIGGGIIDQRICSYVGADTWVNNAMSGVRICQRFVKNRGTSAQKNLPEK